MKQIVVIYGCIQMLLLPLQTVRGQDIDHGSPYSTAIMSNPALAGAHADGLLSVSYRDYFPGQNFGIGSLYLSYDSWFDAVHGGLGGYIIENRMGGLLNDLRSGLTYSYHLRAARDLYINAGFMASVISRNINRTDIIFPDQIDRLLGPVIPSAEVPDLAGRTVFDAGVGFLVSYLNWHAGISFNHLAVPDISFSQGGNYRLARRYMMHVGTSFAPGAGDMRLTPVASASVQGSVISLTTSFIIEYKSIAMNIGGTAINEGLSSLRTGVSVDLERFSLRYNYFFSGGREAGLSPLTLSNKVTLIFSLNNVDKSRVLNAINYPKL